MYPTVDLGFATLATIDAIKIPVAIIVFQIFMSEWKRRFSATTRLWGLGVATFLTAAIATVIGAMVWRVFRPSVLGPLFGTSGFWTGEATEWLFAGILSCLFAATLVLKGTGRPVRAGLDAFAPGLALGQAIYRIGCFLAGDGCYGPATDLPWGVAFPNGTVPVSVPVHPTMLYDAVLMLGVFALLWHLRRRLPPGASIALYLVLTSAVCFFIQFYMLNVEIVAGLTEPQVWSLLVGPAATCAFALRMRTAVNSSPATAGP